MTKREKKELALKLKSEIDAKHAREKPIEQKGISEEQKKKNNRLRYGRRERPDEFVKWLREKGKRNKPGEL